MMEAGNGSTPQQGTEGTNVLAVRLQESFEVQRALETAYGWFLSVDDLLSAGAILSVISSLVDTRLQAAEVWLQGAQDRQAAAMLEG